MKNADPYSSKCNAAVAADGLCRRFAGMMLRAGGTPANDGPRTFGDAKALT